MAMTIPRTLKPVTQFVRRAEKLDTAHEPEAPVVAYYCRLYAVDQAMKLKDNSEEGNNFLVSMITRLEEDKKRGMSQFTEEEGKKITADWAMKEFNAADDEDRAGLADQNTARMFYAAGVFFDVLRQFGEPDEETNRRRVYCKWKASEILKALKEGRTPTPGGAGEDLATGMPPAEGKTPPTAVGGEGSSVIGQQESSEHGIPTLPGAAEPKEYGSLTIPEAPVDHQPIGSPAPPEDAAASFGGEGAAYFTQTGRVPSSAPSYLPPFFPGDPSSSTGGGGEFDGMGAPPQQPLYPTEPGHESISGSVTDPALSWYATQTPAPAPTPAPTFAPAPARPRTPVPSASGSRRSGGGRKPLEGNLADAIEHCRYALRALERKEVDLAVQRLHDALQQIT